MSFDPIAYLNEPRWRTMRPGLDRIRELLDRLGRPQDSLRFVHVAGTNGKGSTCAYLDAIFRAAGYRTGLFTSPYIERFEERIHVDGQMIGADDLLSATCAVRDAAEAMEDHPTEYELMCAVALLHFARSSCEIVVLEVGLGGRLDATNVIDMPEVCVITRIGMDHTAELGSTLAQIAGEKAGIIKPGVPCVSWPQDPEAAAVIADAARAVDAPLIVPDFNQLVVHALSAFGAECGNDTRGGERAAREACEADGVREEREFYEVSREMRESSLMRRFSYGVYHDLAIRLFGSYQPANAALAIEACDALRQRGWNISNQALQDGLSQAYWPGRFEVIAQHPFVVVDGAHNLQGAEALAESLQDVFPDQRPAFVIGVLADKDYPHMLSAVVPLGKAFVAIEPPNPRALSTEDLAAAIQAACENGQSVESDNNQNVSIYTARSIADGVSRACELAGPDGLVCAFGSLYSIAAIETAVFCSP